MPLHRYFLDQPFHEQDTLLLDHGELHHLVHVLRARVGDHVELVNGRCQLAKAHLIDITKDRAKLLLVQVSIEKKPTSALILAQALTRMPLLEWIVEKGTELGATAFWLFPGMLSEKKQLSETQITRLQNIAIASMKQCGRLDLPQIACKPPLLNWSPLLGTLFFGDLREESPLLWKVPLSPPLLSPIVLLIGCESGLHDRERAFLEETLKAKGVRLHSHTLRAETASLTALSLIQQWV